MFYNDVIVNFLNAILNMLYNDVIGSNCNVESFKIRHLNKYRQKKRAS